MLRLKDSIRKLIYDEVYDESRPGQSAIAKCTIDKDDWQCLADIKHFLNPFKEGQEICEAQKCATVCVFSSSSKQFIKS
jgi:hypothetical protein